MYKVNAPIASLPPDVGRTRVFAPGWLENESVWIHMEYKFMLEVLKAGLYEEFFEDFKKAYHGERCQVADDLNACLAHVFSAEPKKLYFRMGLF